MNKNYINKKKEKISEGKYRQKKYLIIIKTTYIQFYTGKSAYKTNKKC